MVRRWCTTKCASDRNEEYEASPWKGQTCPAGADREAAPYRLDAFQIVVSMHGEAYLGDQIERSALGRVSPRSGRAGPRNFAG